MSAFVCGSEHIGQMAHQFIFRTKMKFYGDAEDVAETLARENVRSVTSRYPDMKLERLTGERLDDYIADCRRKANRPIDPSLRPIDVYKMSACYDYQACETEDYASTKAARVVELLKSAAVRSMSGYDEAVYEYEYRRVI